MNIYTADFHATCPNNGARVAYKLTIQTGEVITVESINEALDGIRQGLHEAIADDLLSLFGGSQTLEAHHHGVTIKTIRPHVAHWMRG